MAYLEAAQFSVIKSVNHHHSSFTGQYKEAAPNLDFSAVQMN